jgi:uncharacterized protein (TIGR03437 family)
MAPTSLDGTSITIGGQAAFIDFISPGQVNALIPSNVGTGLQQVTVTNAAGISTPFNITVNAVQPGGRLSETSDPDDNIFLECAQAAKAHYLITGNTRDFSARWKYTDVITPRTFINVWKDLYKGGSPHS